MMNLIAQTLLVLAGILATLPTTHASDATTPIAAETLVFAEKDGLVAVEAEHFIRQELSDVRAFHITTSEAAPEIEPDGDPSHVGGAAGGADG